MCCTAFPPQVPTNSHSHIEHGIGLGLDEIEFFEYRRPNFLAFTICERIYVNFGKMVQLLADLIDTLLRAMFFCFLVETQKPKTKNEKHKHEKQKHKSFQT